MKSIKRQIWNKRILLWWYKLWIRGSEFHKSLDIDPEAVLAMTAEEQIFYIADLKKRRGIARQRNLAR